LAVAPCEGSNFLAAKPNLLRLLEGVGAFVVRNDAALTQWKDNRWQTISDGLDAQAAPSMLRVERGY
jgi:hypothetical protein